MPEIEIRPAIASDIPSLIELDHNYYTDHVWQLEVTTGLSADPLNEQVQAVSIRQVRLPRQVRVEYPYPPQALTEDWRERSGLLVALLNAQPIGYASLMLNIAPFTTWVTDLVVSQPLRRQGIGNALLLASLEWASHMESQNLVLEMQTKNYPAIQLALKKGFEFCGYNDRYYSNHEAGIFFGRSLH
jgi:GNAT superfamily N-acetyltransferase